jgi:hypothetical protein
LLGGVDSTSKCDKSEEAAAQTFLFRRKPHLTVGYGFASKQKCLTLRKALLIGILFCRTSNVKLNHSIVITQIITWSQLLASLPAGFASVL